ncbi:hypothetical protein [Candidatus Synchoanobacter obligatus]|uniref:Phosphate acyltransferase n=1 Tax=Candidatus Synchoanobacter obligatus TaxID=2919597 RepID=A0ABT1L3P5_9GAMM|nr:hypothetical protein [Candidatus Synchoanobacter obligatus]MCP8351769.1 hypothetical protein [Candidatus Synchoanobacter obligatus]
MSKPLKIAVDLMGGDYAPLSTAQAVIAVALESPDIVFQVIAVPHIISQYFATKPSNIVVFPVESAVTMSMTAAEAAKLRQSSSMGKMIELVQTGDADVGVSAGNTAALMSLSYLMLKMRDGVRRPAILSSYSYKGKKAYITDLGANISPKPEDFVSNAFMAVEESGKDQPTIGLMNVGVEETKGTETIKLAANLLEASELNYVGFIEGCDILPSPVDIVLCDGFVGNCMTKLLESMISEAKGWGSDPLCVPVLHSAALFTGLNGYIYKAHGSCKTDRFRDVLLDVIIHAKKRIFA